MIIFQDSHRNDRDNILGEDLSLKVTSKGHYILTLTLW